jgi:hypothetical protein
VEDGSGIERSSTSPDVYIDNNAGDAYIGAVIVRELLTARNSGAKLSGDPALMQKRTLVLHKTHSELSQ